MDYKLNQKVALITGSGRIGLACAFALAREGARIVITDINPTSVEKATDQLRSAGFEAIGVAGDVCVEER